jgi:hypothetical protein
LIAVTPLQNGLGLSFFVDRGGGGKAVRRDQLWGERFIWFAVRQAVRHKSTHNGLCYRETGVVGTFYGVTVVRSDAKVPFGHTTWQGKRLYVTHRVQHLYYCWYDGEMVGHAVRWLCGPFTPHFALVDASKGHKCMNCETKFFAEKLPQQHDTE